MVAVQRRLLAVALAAALLPPLLPQTAGASSPGCAACAAGALSNAFTYVYTWTYPQAAAVDETALLSTWPTYTISVSLTLAAGATLSQASLVLDPAAPALAVSVGMRTLVTIDSDGVITTALATSILQHADLGASSAPMPNIYVGELSDTAIRGNPYVTGEIRVATDTHYGIDTHLSPMAGFLTAAALLHRAREAVQSALAPLAGMLPAFPGGPAWGPAFEPVPFPCAFCLLAPLALPVPEQVPSGRHQRSQGTEAIAANRIIKTTASAPARQGARAAGNRMPNDDRVALEGMSPYCRESRTGRSRPSSPSTSPLPSRTSLGSTPERGASGPSSL